MFPHPLGSEREAFLNWWSFPLMVRGGALGILALHHSHPPALGPACTGEPWWAFFLRTDRPTENLKLPDFLPAKNKDKQGKMLKDTPGSGRRFLWLLSSKQCNPYQDQRSKRGYYLPCFVWVSHSGWLLNVHFSGIYTSRLEMEKQRNKGIFGGEVFDACINDVPSMYLTILSKWLQPPSQQSQ